MRGVVGIHHRAQERAHVLAELVEQEEGVGVPFLRLVGQVAAVPPRAGEELLAAVVLQDAVLEGQAAQLAGAAVGPAEKLAFIDDAHPHAGAQGDDHEGLGLRVGGIGAVDAHREAVRIVVHGHGYAETLLQVLLEGNLRPGRDVLGVVDDALLDVHHRGDAQADLLRAGAENLLDLGGQVLQGLFQRHFRTERRRVDLLDDPSVVDETEAQVGASDVNS